MLLVLFKGKSEEFIHTCQKCTRIFYKSSWQHCISEQLQDKKHVIDFAWTEKTDSEEEQDKLKPASVIFQLHLIFIV
jgi:hypothetical protein